VLVSPVILFFSSEVVSPLCDRFEVQFALCNLAGMGIGLLFIFDNKIIAVCLVFIYLMVVLMAIFIDAAMEREIKSVYFLYQFMARSILMAIRIVIVKDYSIAP